MKGILLLCLLGGLTACSTPQRRIQKNPELFAGFAPEEQDLIRAGQVELGFSPDMVRLARGNPSRRSLRITPDGEIEVWRYIRTVQSLQSTPVHFPGRRGGADWADIPYTLEIEMLRVEFSEGKAVVIERWKE